MKLKTSQLTEHIDHAMSHTPLWMGQLENEKRLLTLTSSIDHFYKTHSVVHYKLFSIRIFYSWLIRLFFCESEIGGDTGEWVGDRLPTTHLYPIYPWWIDGDSVHFGWEKQVYPPTKQFKVNYKSQRMVTVRMKIRDKKTYRPGLPRQFYPHHRLQERPLSSSPFLHFFMSKKLGDFIQVDRKNTSEKNGQRELKRREVDS